MTNRGLAMSSTWQKRNLHVQEEQRFAKKHSEGQLEQMVKEPFIVYADEALLGLRRTLVSILWLDLAAVCV